MLPRNLFLVLAFLTPMVRVFRSHHFIRKYSEMMCNRWYLEVSIHWVLLLLMLNNPLDFIGRWRDLSSTRTEFPILTTSRDMPSVRSPKSSRDWGKGIQSIFRLVTQKVGAYAALLIATTGCRCPLYSGFRYRVSIWEWCQLNICRPPLPGWISVGWQPPFRQPSV